MAAGAGSFGSTRPTDPISATWRRGALTPPAAAPVEGERFEEVLRLRNLVVEHILSGQAVGPQPYVQDHDEWVVVLAGAAALEVDGEPVALGPGQWLFLPSGVPHTVVDTEPGTSWLAVHLR